LSVRARTTYDVDYADIPGCRQLVTRALNPFSRRRLPRVPGIVQVIALSMLSARAELQADDSDVVITPEFTRDIGFMSWDRHTDVLRAAHRDTVAAIRRRLADDDSGLAAVLRRERPMVTA
jgi:NTE family protein